MTKDNLDKVIQLRHLLHQYPELSMKEQRTIRIIQKFLKENTSLEIVDCGTWFYAVKHGAKDSRRRALVHKEVQSLAFRADMDALPIEEGISLSYASACKGVSHKCGHDGHCAALCGFALELDQGRTDNTVYLIFQPAEEIGGGGKMCAKLIREKGISEVYAFHNLGGYPEGEIIFRKGLTQPASEGLTIRMHGKQSHASEPELEQNPGAAIAKAALYSQKLLNGSFHGMVLCTITGIQVGTGDFGISAGEGSLNVTLRAEQEEEMKALETELLQYACKQAKESGLRMEYEISDYFPETRNHDTCLEKVVGCAEKLDIPTHEMKTLWRASEDFGYYLKECPGAMFYIGNGEDYPPLHTGEYDFNDRILSVAVDMFAAIAAIRVIF